MDEGPPSTYTQRLETFYGHWNDSLTAARQLAALGHVCDRPPLESLEPGSRCITCGAFVPKALSVLALGDDAGAVNSEYESSFAGFQFHNASCTRHQVRLPLDPQTHFPGLYGGRSANSVLHDLRSKWDTARDLPLRPGNEIERPFRDSVPQATQPTRTFFSLPLEIRLAIYKLILPSIDPFTQIVPLHLDSPRVLTQAGAARTGPLITTKTNILRTSRAVHAETLDVLYRQTTFAFDATKTLFLFLRSIGPSGRALVRAVDIKAGDREDAVAFALLGSCERLKVLTLRMPRPGLLMQQRSPLWMREGVACLLALSGLEDVRFKAGSGSVMWMHDQSPSAKDVRKALMRPYGHRQEPDEQEDAAAAAAG